MPEIDAQMVLKLHRMSGEPVVHCNYLLTQTNGDYELALKILERVLQQRASQQGKPVTAPDTAGSIASAAPVGEATALSAMQAAPVTSAAAAPAGELEKRVQRLESGFAQLADTLDVVNQKLTMLLERISE